MNSNEMEVASDQIAAKFKTIMRLGDYICPTNNKIYLILQNMSLDSSGVIIKRFNNFFMKHNFSKKPRLDIKEIN